MPSTIILIILALAFPASIHAATPTSTLTPTPQSEIQKIRQAVQEKVKEKLDEITKGQPLKRGIVGTATNITATQITLNSTNGSKVLTVNPDTVYIDLKRNKSSLDKVKVGQSLLCLGYQQPNGSFDAKRIIFTQPQNTTNPNRLVVGKIADFSQSTSVILLIPKQNKDLQYQIKISDKTELIDKIGQKLDFKSTLKSGQLIASIITPDPKINKTYVATKIINLSLPSPTPSDAR